MQEIFFVLIQSFQTSCQILRFHCRNYICCKRLLNLHYGYQVIGKGNQIQDNAVLDGTTPPVVETIIFENTNFKSAPGTRAPRNDKSRKMDDSGPMENSVMSGLNKPFTDLLNKNDKQADIRMQLAFNKEDGSDIKLDFMESEISYLTEDKSSKNIGLPRSMHAITSSNNTISPSTADALNFKIACVKKVWEMPTVIEHNVGQDDGTGFATSFVPDPNSLDPSGPFNKGTDTPEDNNEGYSPTPNQVANNSSTNVCKVFFKSVFLLIFSIVNLNVYNLISL